VRSLRWLPLLVGLLGACSSRQPPAIEEEPRPIPEVGSDAGDATLPPPRTTPYPRADLTVELPFGAPERTSTLAVTATAGRVDVHLAIDTTGSFDGEIDELQEALLTTVIPGLRRNIPSLTLGVSSFEDMPYEPWGATTDLPFELLAAQTSDPYVVSAAVARLDQPIGFGGDRPESWAEALYQIATGEGLRVGARQLVPAFVPRVLPDSGREPGVGFRENSTRVVVLVTDAPTHEAVDYGRVVAGAHSSTQAIEALVRRRVHVVGIASAPDARSSLESMAVATQAVAPPERGVCATGLNGAARAPLGGRCPLVYDIAANGQGLSRTIVDGLTRLLDVAVYDDVHGVATDDPQRFVTAIEAERATPTEGSEAPGRADRLPAGAPDGTPDTFTGVHARTELGFRLHFANRTVPETELPQVFFLRVQIVGDDLVLREMLVRVIVPEGPKLDAGASDARPSDAGPDATEGGEGEG
jgi:hypothetical protein